MAVLLTGDMNDEVDAATTLILNCPPGSEIDTDGFDIPDDGDGDRMWNLAPQTQRFTRVTAAAQSGSTTSSSVTRHRNTHHRRHHGRCSTRDAIEDNPNARQGKPGSDHAADAGL